MLGAPYLFAFAILVAAVGAIYDWRTGHIPNWVTLGPLIAAPFVHFALFALAGRSGEAIEAAGFSVIGALACGLVPVLLFRAGAMGGGDVKLLAAVGAIMRPLVGVEAELYAFVAAALYGPAKLAYEGKLLRTLKNSLALALNPLRPKEKRVEVPQEVLSTLRFGPSILVGTVAAVIMHWRAE